MAGTAELRAAIDGLVRDASIEALPGEVTKGGEGWAALPRGTRVFITRLPGAGFEETVTAARRLRERGLRPVPHVTARGTNSPESLAETLHRLREEGGVDDILLIAGTQDPPAGVYRDALAILDSGILERAGLRRIGVAGHPEGHPDASGQALDDALEAKNAYARKTGIELYLVTQFFFDAAPVIAWERRIRRQGNRLPVHPGLHGVTGLASLARHGARCGVGASLKMLTRPGRIAGLIGTGTPNGLLVDIARAALDDPDTLFSAIHLYPLGGFARTAAWLARLRAGDFEIGENGLRLSA